MNDEQVVAELTELGSSLVTGKTTEEKKLEGLIEITTDQGLKGILSERLDEIRTASGADPEDVIARLDEMGYPLAQIIRLGVTKLKQQINWRIKNKSAELDI